MDSTQLQSEIRDIFLNQDSSDAIKLIKVIRSEPVLDEPMKLLLVQLQFIRMYSLSTDQLLTLLEKSLLASYTIPDFTLSERIESYVEQVESLAEQVNVARKIRLTIQDNESVFSEGNIVVKGQEIPGSIKNWIADFNTYPIKGEKTKGALEEVEYLSKSPNVKNISEVQKGVLRDILNMYDYLNAIIANWDSIPVPKTAAEASEGFDFYEHFSGLEDDLQEEREADAKRVRGVGADESRMSKPIDSGSIDELLVKNGSQRPKPQPQSQAPILTTTQPTPAQRQAVDDITRAPHTPVNYNTGTPGANSGAMSSADSAKIRDLINHVPPDNKRGVTMDPTNVKIDEEEQRLNSARAKQAADIQRKLAELRTRNVSKGSTDNNEDSETK